MKFSSTKSVCVDFNNKRGIRPDHTAIADSAQESVSGQRSGAKVEPGTGLIHSLIGEKSVTERWLVSVRI